MHIGSFTLTENGCPLALIFGRAGRGPFGGFSKGKRALDKRMERELPTTAKRLPWVLHSLRRAARSLMSRAGGLVDHPQRQGEKQSTKHRTALLNHAISGVQGVYDRHAAWTCSVMSDRFSRRAATTDVVISRI